MQLLSPEGGWQDLQVPCRAEEVDKAQLIIRGSAWWLGAHSVPSMVGVNHGMPRGATGHSELTWIHLHWVHRWPAEAMGQRCCRAQLGFGL